MLLAHFAFDQSTPPQSWSLLHGQNPVDLLQVIDVVASKHPYDRFDALTPRKYSRVFRSGIRLTYSEGMRYSKPQAGFSNSQSPNQPIQQCTVRAVVRIGAMSVSRLQTDLMRYQEIVEDASAPPPT